MILTGATRRVLWWIKHFSASAGINGRFRPTGECLMPLLEWSAALELGQPAMDATHRDFVDFLNCHKGEHDNELEVI
jgi:hypothetical protein